MASVATEGRQAHARSSKPPDKLGLPHSSTVSLGKSCEDTVALSPGYAGNFPGAVQTILKDQTPKHLILLTDTWSQKVKMRKILLSDSETHIG